MKNYAPRTIDDIVFESNAQKSKIEQIINGKIDFPGNGISGIMLHGKPGTGKTALANILPFAIELNKSGGGINPDVETHQCLSGQNGVSLIDRIRNQLSTYSIMKGSGLRYYVLHEVDNLTPIALKQLKSVMEMPDAIFIFTTNNIGAFEPALLSRCVRVSFNPTDPNIWLPRIKALRHAMGKTGQHADEFLSSIVKQENFCARQILFHLQLLP